MKKHDDDCEVGGEGAVEELGRDVDVEGGLAGHEGVEFVDLLPDEN